MTISLTHAFVPSGAPAVEDPNSGVPGGRVGPNEWNANHVLTQATNTLLGRGAAGVGATQEISLVNDTNVTAALTSGLLTLGWTGTLAAGRLNAAVVQGVANDTNVTGSIAAQNLTLGWTGTLAAGRLNANVVQGITNDTNVTGSIVNQVLTLGWTGTLAAARLNANVVQGITNDTNVTGSIAAQVLTLGWTGTLALSRFAQGTTGQILAAQTSAASIYTATPTIGTSVTVPLVIGGTAAGSALQLESTSGAGTSDLIQFFTGSQVERLRIDTNGVLVWGGTVAQTSDPLQIVTSGTGIANSGLGLLSYTGVNNNNHVLSFYFSNSTTVGANGAVSNGQELGDIFFYGNDGAGFKRSVAVRALADGAHSAGSSPGVMQFHTTPSGSTALVERQRIDNAGVVWNKGSGFGYGPAGAGAGGTVTQLTSKATGVTLSKICGEITMNAAALAASTTVSFVLTNTLIAATDLVILNHVSGGTAGSYTLNAQTAAGSATINVRNVSLGSLSEAIVIGFAVVKAQTT